MAEFTKIAREHNWWNASGAVFANVSGHVGELPPLHLQVKNLLLGKEEAIEVWKTKKADEEIDQHALNNRNESALMTKLARGKRKHTIFSLSVDGTVEKKKPAAAEDQDRDSNNSKGSASSGGLDADDLILLRYLGAQSTPSHGSNTTQAKKNIYSVKEYTDSLSKYGILDDAVAFCNVVFHEIDPETAVLVKRVGVKIIVEVFVDLGAIIDPFKKELTEYGFTALDVRKMFTYLKDFIFIEDA